MGVKSEGRVLASQDKKTSCKEHTTQHVRKAEELLTMPAFPWSGLLSDSRIVKAGPSLKHDLHALKQVFLFEEKNILDHGHVARASGSGQTGVRNLAGFYLGFRIPKSTKTPNWVVRELSPAQITYAATDAWGYRESYLEFERQGMVRQS